MSTSGGFPSLAGESGEAGQQSVHQRGGRCVTGGVTWAEELLLERDLVAGAGQQDRSRVRIRVRADAAEGLLGDQVFGDHLGAALRATDLRGQLVAAPPRQIRVGLHRGYDGLTRPAKDT